MDIITRKTLQWTSAQLMEIRRDNFRIMKQLSLCDSDNGQIELDSALLELEKKFSVIKARVDFEKRQISRDGGQFPA